MNQQIQFLNFQMKRTNLLQNSAENQIARGRGVEVGVKREAQQHIDIGFVQTQNIDEKKQNIELNRITKKNWEIKIS